CLLYPDDAASYGRPEVVDVFAALAQPPEPCLLRGVEVVDRVHPLQTSLNQQNEHDAKIHSALSYDHWVTLFQPRKQDLLDTLLFEWFAALFDSNPHFHEDFHLAGREKLELPGFENIDSERKAWAALGAQLFKVNEEVAFLLSMANPFR